MGARHVLGDRGVAASVRRPGVAGDALPLEEDLDGLVGDAHVDEFLDQTEGRRVPVAVDFDMVIGRNPAALPDREGVGFVGQRLQRRPVDRGEQFGPARVVALHDAGVDVADEFADRDIEIGQAEETAIAQPGQDPPLGDQHRLLDLGLVARLVGPRRQDRHAVMARRTPCSCGSAPAGIDPGS